MILKVMRKVTTAGEELVFDFGYIGRKFLIKNLTEGDIYVGFSPGGGGSEAEMILIPEETAQVITSMSARGRDIVYVLPDESSERGVEVQLLEGGLKTYED